MGYHPERIQRLVAQVIPPRIHKARAIQLGMSEKTIEETIGFKKADSQIRIEIVVNDVYLIETISLKKANHNAGYHQVDKRCVDRYQRMWHIPQSVVETLKRFTGETVPVNTGHLRDPRRLFLDEIERDKVEDCLMFFNDNKGMIISDVLRGRGPLSADWLLVTKQHRNRVEWVLHNIHFVCQFCSQGPTTITTRGNLKLGRLTMQRKGGTPDPTSLQFKFNPLALFDTNPHDPDIMVPPPPPPHGTDPFRSQPAPHSV